VLSQGPLRRFVIHRDGKISLLASQYRGADGRTVLPPSPSVLIELLLLLSRLTVSIGFHRSERAPITHAATKPRPFSQSMATRISKRNPRWCTSFFEIADRVIGCVDCRKSVSVEPPSGVLVVHGLVMMLVRECERLKKGSGGRSCSLTLRLEADPGHPNTCARVGRRHQDPRLV
jgi:hypothetical protein